MLKNHYAIPFFFDLNKSRIWSKTRLQFKTQNWQGGESLEIRRKTENPAFKRTERQCESFGLLRKEKRSRTMCLRGKQSLGSLEINLKRNKKILFMGGEWGGQDIDRKLIYICIQR